MNDTTLKDPLIWIDCETTGLDTKHCSIIEICVVVTDGKNLDDRSMGPHLIIKCSDEDLGKMNEWCTKTHNESGLIDKVKKSTISMKEAE